MDSQIASPRLSVWAGILSSSIAVAMITGVFFLVGGAERAGYSEALGLSYLAGLQSAEYIFSGAELLLVWLFIFGVAIAVAVAEAFSMRPAAKRKYFPREWERYIFSVLTIIPTFLLAAYAVWMDRASRDLASSGACPVTGHGSVGKASVVCVGLILFVSVTFGFFFSRLLRFTFLTWAAIACIFCLYYLGWAFGAARLYDEFKIARLTSASAQLPVDTKALIIGADDKNLVVLVPSSNEHTQRAEPIYLLRSDVKALRIVGSSSINDFLCKPIKPVSK